jgi:hypothetical protein
MTVHKEFCRNGVELLADVLADAQHLLGQFSENTRRQGSGTERQPGHGARRRHPVTLELSYAAIDPGEASERVESPTPPIHRTPVHKPGPTDFRRGDKVSFTDKYLQPQISTITRVNQRTASVDCESGSGWSVPFATLRHVTDI